MHNTDEEDKQKYIVLVNHEEQYSLWQADLEIPGGWKKTDCEEGTKESCLEYVNKVWVDMRPKSLRDKRK